MASNWIAGATKNKGGLHRSLGVPQGQKIPPERIRAAAKRPGLVGKQARLALTLTGMQKSSPDKESGPGEPLARAAAKKRK